MNFNFLLLTLLSFFWMSCDSSSHEEDFGLKRISITMDAEDLGELNNSYQAKRPFAARVDFNGRVYRGKVNYAGKSTIDAFKKSLHLTFNKPVFFGRSSIRLSSQNVDDSLLRSLLGFKVFGMAGLMVPKVEPVAIYLNQKYMGLYQMIEPVDMEFFQVRGESPLDLYKAKFANANFGPEYLGQLDDAYTVRIKPKSASAIRYLWELAIREDEASYDELEKILDIENYLNYVAAAVILKHWDGFDNNYFLARMQDGRFRIVPWDLDRIYEAFFLSNLSYLGSNNLTAKLLEKEKYLSRYLEILEEQIARVEAEGLDGKIDQWGAKIAQAYQQDRVLQTRSRMSDSHGTLKATMKAWIEGLKSELSLLN